MGLLTDFFLVDPAHVSGLDAASIEVRQYRCLESKGIDSIHVEALMDALGLDAEPLEPLDPDGEEAWLFVMPPPLVNALAALDEGSVTKVAGVWLQAEEFQPVGPGDAESCRAFLGELSALAREAKTTGKSMLHWVSL